MTSRRDSKEKEEIRKALERVLGRLLKDAYLLIGELGDFISSGSEELAFYRGAQAFKKCLTESEDPIMIEAEVEHKNDPAFHPYTVISKRGKTIAKQLGHHGTSGPHLFIGLPLEEEDED